MPLRHSKQHAERNESMKCAMKSMRTRDLGGIDRDRSTQKLQRDVRVRGEEIGRGKDCGEPLRTLVCGRFDALAGRFDSPSRHAWDPVFSCSPHSLHLKRGHASFASSRWSVESVVVPWRRGSRLCGCLCEAGLGVCQGVVRVVGSGCAGVGRSGEWAGVSGDDPSPLWMLEDRR
jgi:hypothetical protein